MSLKNFFKTSPFFSSDSAFFSQNQVSSFLLEGPEFSGKFFFTLHLASSLLKTLPPSDSFFYFIRTLQHPHLLLLGYKEEFFFIQYYLNQFQSSKKIQSLYWFFFHFYSLWRRYESQNTDNNVTHSLEKDYLSVEEDWQNYFFQWDIQCISDWNTELSVPNQKFINRNISLARQLQMILSEYILIHHINYLKDKIYQSGAKKIIIISSFDSINTSASNAMLKLLEENVNLNYFFCLCHHSYLLLSTIRSRLKQYSLDKDINIKNKIFDSNKIDLSHIETQIKIKTSVYEWIDFDYIQNKINELLNQLEDKNCDLELFFAYYAYTDWYFNSKKGQASSISWDKKQEKIILLSIIVNLKKHISQNFSFHKDKSSIYLNLEKLYLFLDKYYTNIRNKNLNFSLSLKKIIIYVIEWYRKIKIELK